MRAGVEFGGALVVALGLHVALVVQMPGGAESAGDGGAALASIAPAAGGLAVLVAQWDAPPEVAMDAVMPAPMPEAAAPTMPRADEPVIPPAPTMQPSASPREAAPIAAAPLPPAPAPDVPDTAPAAFALPVMPQAAPRALVQVAPGSVPGEIPLPQAPATPAMVAPLAGLPDSAVPAPPPPELSSPFAFTPTLAEARDARAPITSPVPRARPAEVVARAERASTPPRSASQAVAPQINAPQSTAARPAAPQRAQTAAGEGGAGQRGDQGRAVRVTLSDGARQSLVAGWGGQIRAQVERARPRTGQRGVVRVTLTVARDGRLLGAGIAASSGNDDLDRAALRTVQGAGRFRPAPEGLDGAEYAFRLPIRFD